MRYVQYQVHYRRLGGVVWYRAGGDVSAADAEKLIEDEKKWSAVMGFAPCAYRVSVATVLGE